MTENLKLIELSCPNIRELTKKERLYGLNIKSWYVCLMLPLILQGYIGFLNAFFLCLGMIAFFFVAEYFDEDIMDIFLSKIIIKNESPTYYA